MLSLAYCYQARLPSEERRKLRNLLANKQENLVS